MTQGLNTWLQAQVFLQLLCDFQVREDTGKKYTEQFQGNWGLPLSEEQDLIVEHHSVRKERILANRSFKT